MKFITLLGVFLFSSLIYGSTKVDCSYEANKTTDPLVTLIRCLEDPNNFTPSNAIKASCGDIQETSGKGKNCNSRGETIGHCREGKNGFCFDGKSILKKANKFVLTMLCTNMEFPPVPSSTGYLKFGGCKSEDGMTFADKGLRVPGKLSCYCQNHGTGLSWTCYDVRVN